MPKPNHLTTQNMLSEATDAIIRGENVDSVLARYRIARADVQDLLEVIELINYSFVPVEPSPQFSRQLKAELVGKPEPDTGFAWRLWRLPARVQFAAIATVLGGFVLLIRQTFFGEEASETNEENAAQEKI